MTKEERMKEIVKASPDFGKRVGYKMCVVDELHDMKELQEEIAELEKENAELKEVHESDKRSLALIAKKSADFEKAYNEAEELLDKQIEATYKLFEENKELKEEIKNNEDLATVAYMQGAGNQKKKDDKQLTYAKTIIQDLLENTDEYTRQRAEDFLKENK